MKLIRLITFISYSKMQTEPKSNIHNLFIYLFMFNEIVHKTEEKLWVIVKQWYAEKKPHLNRHRTRTSAKRSPYTCMRRSRATVTLKSSVYAVLHLATPSLCAPALKWTCTNEKTAKNVDDEVVRQRKATRWIKVNELFGIFLAQLVYFTYMCFVFIISLRFYLCLTLSTDLVCNVMIFFFSSQREHFFLF